MNRRSTDFWGDVPHVRVTSDPDSWVIELHDADDPTLQLAYLGTSQARELAARLLEAANQADQKAIGVMDRLLSDRDRR